MIRKIFYSIIITLFFCFPFQHLTAQNEGGKLDISGQWLGEITQEEGGYSSKYEFELYISQTGNKIKGRTYSRVEDLYTVLDVKGEIKSGKIVFLEETNIVDVHLPDGLYACYKKAQLVISLKDGKLQMEGFWRGDTEDGACIPGKVLLFKEKPRA